MVTSPPPFECTWPTPQPFCVSETVKPNTLRWIKKMITFPIGGHARLTVDGDQTALVITDR